MAKAKKSNSLVPVAAQLMPINQIAEIQELGGIKLDVEREDYRLLAKTAFDKRYRAKKKSMSDKQRDLEKECTQLEAQLCKDINTEVHKKCEKVAKQISAAIKATDAEEVFCDYGSHVPVTQCSDEGEEADYTDYTATLKVQYGDTRGTARKSTEFSHTIKLSAAINRKLLRRDAIKDEMKQLLQKQLRLKDIYDEERQIAIDSSEMAFTAQRLAVTEAGQLTVAIVEQQLADNPFFSEDLCDDD